MTSKRTRLIAMLLAASLFLNTAVLPIGAEAPQEPTVQEAVEPTQAPVSEPAAPAADEPAQPAETPAPATEAPTEAPTAAPTEAPTQAPTEATVPTEEPTVPTEVPTQAPTEATEPTEETEAPTEPTEETEAPTDPTEETEEPTDPTEETEPELDEAALLAAQQEGFEQAIQYYKSMPVTSDRDMPLEWWYVMTGRVTMREPDLSVLERASAPADEPQADPEALSEAEVVPYAQLLGDWSDYVEFPGEITVRTAGELILLSYVTPRAYEHRTITLLADAGLEFDLVTPIVVNEGSEYEQTLDFLGLGALDAPFAGILRFGALSEGIYFVLSRALFTGLYCDAQFLNLENQNNPIRLESRAEYASDGLLAVHVLGESGMEADWHVQLNAPTAEDGKHYCLPSLLGVMYGNANVHLTLTDISQLEPSARGYLCASMYGNAALNAVGVTRQFTGDLAAALVGTLSADAALHTDAQAEPTETAPEEAALTEEEYLARLEKAVAYYSALPLIPGEMPLEWWYVVTGQATPGSAVAGLVINGSDFLRYLAEEPPADEPAAEEPTTPQPDVPTQPDTEEPTDATPPAQTEPPAAESSPSAPATDNLADARVVPYADVVDDGIALYAITDADLNSDTLIIGSADDLIYLSQVNASLYQSKTLEIKSGDGGSDHNLSGTAFLGLGSEAAPFSGTLSYLLGSEAVSFVIDRPLFNALSSSAQIASINLKCAVTAAADGLLAQTVTGGGSATWTVNLKVALPPSGEVVTYCLSSLIGTMKSGADVTLQVTDETGLSVQGSGFLCAKMEADTKLTASGLPDAITVSGGSADTGSLVGSMGDNAVLNVDLSSTFTPTVTASGGSAGGIVGSMAGNASLTVSAEVAATVSNKSGNAGGLAGSMGSTASLVLLSAITVDVSNKSGSAGGLAGSMADSASLRADKAISVIQVTGTTYAGGIVGTCTNPTFTFGDTASIQANSDASAISCAGAAGGIAGQMVWSSGDAAMTVLPIRDLAITNGDSGGLYGALQNSGKEITISYPGKALVSNVTLTSRGYHSANGGCCGGLIGWYQATAANSTLIVNTNVQIKSISGAQFAGGFVGAPESNSHILKLSGKVTMKSAARIQLLGGLVGAVRKNTAYVEISNAAVQIDSYDTINLYGGLIAELEDNGSLLYVGENVDLSGTTITGVGSVGGLVGRMLSGVLYIAKNPTMPTSKATNVPGVDVRGWVLGERGNTLVCTEEDWTPNAGAAYQMNDTNKWGQVLSLTKFSGLVTLDTTAHTVTINELVSATGGVYSIGNIREFASVALRMQLNPKGKLIIPNDVGANVSLKLTADIDLDGTGLTGLTRDHNSSNTFNITLDGNEKKITLPSLTVFASSGAHNRQGLIAQPATLTVKNLTVGGTGNIDSLSDGVHSGIACEVEGPAALTGVTSEIVWNFSGTSGGGTKLSGMISEITRDGKAVTFDDCTWTGSITDSSSGSSHNAGFLAYINKAGTNISVKSCQIAGSITHEPFAGEAPVGGLIARIQGSNTTLSIESLSVSGSSITVLTQWGWGQCGGLLGYEWKDTAATFTGVTIENSSLKTDRSFGGLIYKGSGYWKLTEKNGIKFTSGNTFEGKSDDGTPSALLVCNGTENPALYLEVLYQSYDDSGATVTLTNGQYFDSLMGKSIAGDGNDAIVSIATAGSTDATPHKIDIGSCNTFKTHISDAFKNPRTRYDYNLDSFDRDTASDGTISTPEEMVLWSAYHRCNQNLEKYFIRGNGQTISGTIDLNGYAFYPTPYEGTSITDATIIFAFEALESIEQSGSNILLSDSNRQHYGMHTGIFSQAVGTGTMTVTDLTLQGTVGGYNNQYGALIRGDARGNNVNNILTLNIQGVLLDGIRVYPAPSADKVTPLLIWSIGSYTTLNMSEVQTVANSYAASGKAASSLIGYAGSDNAEYIQLHFSKMQLQESGEKSKDCTIFTRALFLESFRYSGDTCRGVYNFVNSDPYTLGRELSNTEDGSVSGRNNGEQYWFYQQYDDSGYEYKVVDPNGSPAGTFVNYTRYVHEKEDNEKVHELDINLVSPDLLVGCGTYSHPYIISSPKQLQALAQAIQNGGTRSGWKVKVSIPVMDSNCDFSQQDGHTAEALQADGTEAVRDGERVYTSTADNWTSDAGTIDNGKMLRYLRNAYYKITESFTLKDWTGLGTKETGQQFSGVIVGGDGVTITISSHKTYSQFGGLVKFSRGCVVKDLAIQYAENGAPVISCSQVPSNADASFFGGVVGWCWGGDTVIDNVKVTYASQPTATGNNPYLAAMGGYVGMVGGGNNSYGGGVIFRNVASSGFTAQYGNYSNPYIGRVLDGFALTEGEGLGSPTSNYFIPNVAGAELTVNGSSTTVSSGAGLWVLAAIINSSGSNSSGKPRAGDYSLIGTSVAGSTLVDEISGNPSYLVTKYCNRSTPATDSLNLTLDGDCDVSGYGSGFRGIGAIHGNGHQSLRLGSVNGNGNTVTQAQDLHQYHEEKDNWYIFTAGLFPDPAAIDSIQNLILSGSVALDYAKHDGSVLQGDWEVFSNGSAGLLIGRCGGTTNLTNIQVRDAKVTANVRYVGGLAGQLSNSSNLTVDGCSYQKLTVYGVENVGGLFGNISGASCEIKNLQGSKGDIQIPANYPNIGTNYSPIRTGLGGLIGFLDASPVVISGVTLNGDATVIQSDGVAGEIGVGAVIGFWRISNWWHGKASAEKIHIEGSLTINGSSKSTVGGFIGFLSNSKSDNWTSYDNGANFTASNIYVGTESGSAVTLNGHQVGGIIGMGMNGQTDDYRYFTFDRIYIGSSNSTVTITGSCAAASLVGVLCKCPVVKASNIYLNNNTVSGGSYTALFVASPDNQTNAVQEINIWNAEAIGCTLSGGSTAAAGKANPGTGFLYGSYNNAYSQSKGFTMNGYNILVKDSIISDSTNAAIWGGVNKDREPVHLVAVSAVGCKTPAVDFAAGVSNCYAVRADYTGNQTLTDLDARPYVPSNPESPLVIAGHAAITGDGAAFASGTIPMGQKIAEAASATECKSYFNVAEVAKFFTDKDNSCLISNYTAGGDNRATGDRPANFPVLVVSAEEQAVVTKLIYNYISLLTNQPFDKAIWDARVEQIGITTYKWDGSAFTALDTPSLSQNDSRQIWVTKNCYDNEKDQFTLLDVAFINPTATQSGGGSYHLYIPVIVKKVLEFRFWASTDVGTTYYAPAYDSYSEPAIGAHAEPFTALIGYEYDRSIEDWQAVIDNGDNLLWNYEKSLVLDYASNQHLPDGTMLTLVDRNNQDKAYFLKTSPGASISFKDFGWKPSYLCDGLGLTATESDAGTYIVTDEASATVRVGSSYYRLATQEDDESANRFEIKVTKQLSEQYYLTILTPAKADSILNFTIQSPDRLTVPEGVAGIPTKRVTNTPSGKDYTRRSDENRIVMGSFFTQTFTVTATNPTREMSSANNNSLTATLETKISFASEEAATLFRQYGQSKQLCQRFDLYLTRCEADEETQTSFAANTQLEVTYLKNGAQTAQASSTLSGNTSARLLSPSIPVSELTGSELTLTAQIKLTYTDAGIIEQFPVGASDDPDTGILICGSSYLAYSSEALEQSSAPVTGRDGNNRRYYRADYSAANLHYVATGASTRARLDQLGINGLAGDSFSISSAAQYDVKALNAAANAAKLHCTVTLLCKNNSGEYVAALAPVAVKIGATVVGANGAASSFTPVSGTNVSFDLSNGIDGSIPIQIPVELIVTTGAGLESGGNTYANYRVLLEAKLLDSNGAIITGSAASDYIVYTNAKIITSLILPSQS